MYTSHFCSSLYLIWLYTSSLKDQCIWFRITSLSVKTCTCFLYTCKTVHFLFYTTPSVSLLHHSSCSSLWTILVSLYWNNDRFEFPCLIFFLYRNNGCFLVCTSLFYETFSSLLQQCRFSVLIIYEICSFPTGIMNNFCGPLFFENSTPMYKSIAYFLVSLCFIMLSPSLGILVDFCIFCILHTVYCWRCEGVL